MKYLDTIQVFCRTQFIGYHRWENAPDEVAFLRSNHRHVFHVKIVCRVKHGDRDVEFIMLKREVDNYILLHFQEQTFTKSCEMIAAEIMDYLCSAGYMPIFGEVSEDGENGGTIHRFYEGETITV